MTSRPLDRKGAQPRRRRVLNALGFSAAVVAGLGATSIAGSTTPQSAPAPVSVHLGQAPAVFPASSPCPLSGDSRGDPALNAQKNRYGAPATADVLSNVMTASDLIDLPAPQELQSLHRDAWPDDDNVANVEALESRAAVVTGYLIGIKEEDSGSGESCNCHDPKRLFDYHIYLADTPNVPIAQAAVVEMTPRWRSVHTTWGTSQNNFAGYHRILALKGQQVRVTGWLLFDEEHLDQVGEYRATVWEIHPITTFEYRNQGAWTAL